MKTTWEILPIIELSLYILLCPWGTTIVMVRASSSLSIIGMAAGKYFSFSFFFFFFTFHFDLLTVLVYITTRFYFICHDDDHV